MQHALHIHDRRRRYIAMASYIVACGCMDMTLYFVNCTKPERCTTHIVWIMPVQRHSYSYCMTILHSMTISFFFVTITVPSIAPTNTFSQVIDSRTLLLSWEDLPLEHHNGVLQGYNVSIVEQETGRELYHSSASSMLTVTSLHPAYNYEWRVTAFTRIGEGPASFPPNRVQTSEDGNIIFVS